MRKTFLVGLLSPSLLLAQQYTSYQERVDARNDAVHGRLGFALTSQYFFRGIEQENQGIIAQPTLDLSLNVHEGDEGLRQLNIVTGIFESLHSGPTGSTGGVWYESRYYLGVEGQFGERFAGGVRYNTYATPNGSAQSLNNTVEELQFQVQFDDAGIFSKDWTLFPTATVAFELEGQRDGGNERGIYAELAISPAWTIGEIGDAELTLKFPSRIGVSLKDYYEQLNGGDDDFFGYIQSGGVVSAPLNFRASRLGPWRGYAGLHLILLGNNNDERNGDDRAELFFEFGMSTDF